MPLKDNIEIFENKKLSFKRTISWKYFKSLRTTQTKNNNLDYLIDQTFRNINRFFVLPFKNGNDDSTRNYFYEYYMPLVEIKDFNALTDNKPLFDQHVKTNKKLIKNFLKCQEIIIIQ